MKGQKIGQQAQLLGVLNLRWDGGRSLPLLLAACKSSLLIDRTIKQIKRKEKIDSTAVGVRVAQW